MTYISKCARGSGLTRDADVIKVRTMFNELQMLHMRDMQRHWKLVNEDRAEANGWIKEQDTTDTMSASCAVQPRRV